MTTPWNTSSLGVDIASGQGIVIAPSPDTTGVSSATAILNAWNAGYKSVTLAPFAPWYIKNGMLVNSVATNYWINAQGCFINGVGTGRTFRLYDNSNYNARTTAGGGILGFPTIDGTLSTGDSYGIHAGDILQFRLDVNVQNYQSSVNCKNVWLDNQYYQTEQLKCRIRSQSSYTNVQFDNSTGTSLSASANGSYDRLDCDIFIEQNGIGDGVVFNNGAFNVDGAARLGIWGNWQTNATTTYAALKLTGNSVASGFSNYSFGQLFMGCELDSTGAHNPQTINFGSGSNSIFKVTGLLDFSQGSAWTPTNAAGNMLFSGPAFGDANLVSLVSLGSPTFVQNITGNGQTIFTAYLQQNKLTGTGGFTGMILSPGAFDGQTTTLINNGAGTLTFAVAGTSHVAQGTGAILATNVPRTFIWIAADSLWY